MIKEEYSAIRTPLIEANNFELKPTLITMMQQNQFTRHLSKDPNGTLGQIPDDGQHSENEWCQSICNKAAVVTPQNPGVR